jgi:hypothetical protein
LVAQWNTQFLSGYSNTKINLSNLGKLTLVIVLTTQILISLNIFSIDRRHETLPVRLAKGCTKGFCGIPVVVTKYQKYISIPLLDRSDAAQSQRSPTGKSGENCTSSGINEDALFVKRQIVRFQ